MRDYPDRQVMIEGHTDSRGSDDYNRDLSERRADAVRDALVDRTIDAGRIRSVGLGEIYPVASNDSSAGQQQNRRVEIVISDEQGAFPSGAERTASRQ
jgi:outer membrane protein OmpA-like peptidoglycan-associated protein